VTEHFGPSPLPQLCNCECHDFWKSYDADSLRELGEKMFRAFQASECASPDETIVGIEEPMRAEFVAMLETFVSSSQLTVTNETPASTSVSRPFYRTWIIVDCSRPRWWWPWVSSGGPGRTGSSIAPSRIRTSDLRIRSPVLLRAGRSLLHHLSDDTAADSTRDEIHGWNCTCRMNIFIWLALCGTSQRNSLYRYFDSRPSGGPSKFANGRRRSSFLRSLALSG
jgi:hypothetical protein